MASFRSGLHSLATCGLLAILSSWPAMVKAACAADYFVHSLPGLPADSQIKMHAGHIEVTPEHNGNLFFWHFENQHIADRQRTVIWLNGGPGCSSEDGALMEIGPFRLKDENTLVKNNGSWHEFANLLFVDNPVGTGFSYVDTNSYVHDLDEMANQFVSFLEKWFAIFPHFEHDDIYIAGESYAGQHIPYIARAMLARNQKPEVAEKKMVSWNLKGLLIGNGWISPPEQYEAYLSFAYEKGLLKKGSPEGNTLDQQWDKCNKELAETGLDRVDNTNCEAILQEMLRLTSVKNSKGESECINMYDVRLKDSYPSCGMNWPPDLKSLTPYLRKDEVIVALHINKEKVTGWTECKGAVGAAFNAANSKPSITIFPELLKSIEILLFSGAEDLICNHLGTEAFIGNMEWNGGKGFELSPGNWAPRQEWSVEDEAAGFWQEARKLTYVLFSNSSHMVPFDYARRTREMLDRFMGVDISGVGGTPSGSTLDGEKQPDTSVSGVTNSTSDTSKEQEVEAAKWSAYRRSGEVVLVIVIVAASAWGFWVWRNRRHTIGYEGLAAAAARVRGNSGLDTFRNRVSSRDIEAGDFDESQLDDLHVRPSDDMERDRYSIGGEDSDEGESQKKPLDNGQRREREK